MNSYDKDQDPGFDGPAKTAIFLATLFFLGYVYVLGWLIWHGLSWLWENFLKLLTLLD